MLHALPEEPGDGPPPTFRPNLISDISEYNMVLRDHYRYQTAKVFFDCKEYVRCAAVSLSPGFMKYATSSFDPHIKEGAPFRELINDGMSQNSLILALYALMLSGEKTKMEKTTRALGPPEDLLVVNEKLPLIQYILAVWFHPAWKRNNNPRFEKSEGWLEYLSGPSRPILLLIELIVSQVWCHLG